MRSRLHLMFAWCAFLSAGFFYALMTPLGEGIDEPAHFAYVQYVAQTGQPPLGRAQYVSEEMDLFFRQHPVSWSLHTLDASLQSQDKYWMDSADERGSQDRKIRELRFSNHYIEAAGGKSTQYESHQPPAYYYLMAPVFAAASRLLSFPNTFLAVRICSVLLASFLIPGAFLLGRTVFPEKDAAHSVLALVVLFPGLYPGVVRVSNDALAVPMASWFLFLLITFVKTDRSRYFNWLCVAAVLGLWTKAFFIPVLCAAILTLLISRKRRPAVVLLLISAAGIPWYLLNLGHTGSFTGLPETVSANTSLLSSIDALPRLDWGNMFNVLRFSHIWIGNGSLLNVRSWMYEVMTIIFLIGVAGLLWKPARLGQRTIWPLILTYGVFGTALVYYATQVLQKTGTSVIQGWYLTMLIPLEAVLFTAGVQSWSYRHWPRLIGVLLTMFFALLTYGSLFVALPYYSGLTSHGVNGLLATYHPSFGDFFVMTSRQLRFSPFVPLFSPWAFFSVLVAFWIHALIDTETTSRSWSAPSNTAVQRNADS